MDNNTNEIIPVILAGGSGSRLWPKSRKLYPKQFLRLFSEFSLLQETIMRLHGVNFKRGIIICNEAHRFLVAEQLREIDSPHFDIMLEPISRNTAPAIATACFQAKKINENACLLVLPADHLIDEIDVFQKAIEDATRLAQKELLVTFGIKPNSPQTGFGYIQKGPAINSFGYRIDNFIEKPSLAKATEYVSQDDFYWNSGMFVFKAKCYLEALAELEPTIHKASQNAFLNASSDLDFVRLDKESFEHSPDNSIDFAVMEKTPNAAVIPINVTWSDVGSWQQVWEQSEKDEFGNSLSVKTFTDDSQNNLIRSKRLVCAIGVNNLAIIDEDDALLVVALDKSQQVKTNVEKLQNSHLPETLHHRKVYRPWGKYDAIDEGERFQVKRITVKPGEKLSTQKHYHRAEHWVIVKGTAKVQNGDKSYFVSENESTYIPIGQVHSLENPGKIPLEIIEIQTGAYLGEDDIVRFEDKYGRIKENLEA